MKTLSLLVLCAALTVSVPALTAAPIGTEPAIESLHGRIVRVRVPAGFDRVTLQQRIVPRPALRGRVPERWRTLATRYPRGAESVIRFRLPTLIGKRFLRVLGNKTTPLNGDLLTGITSFLPDPIDATENLNPTPGNLSLGETGVASTNGLSLSQTGSVTTPRTVEESDIWKVQGDRLYFYNQLRGLQVFDVANPDAPTLLGTLRMPGAGEEMYLLGKTHAVLLKQSFTFNWWGPIFVGSPLITFNTVGLNSAPTGALSLAATATPAVIKPRETESASSEIIVADVRAGAPTLVARVPFDGSLRESRLVGTVLYVAANVSREATDTAPAQNGLQLTSFDLADPEHPVQRDTLFLGGWAKAVSATDRYFIVAKYANTSWWETALDLIDISAPNGAMQRAGTAVVQGDVANKFNLHIEGDVLTAVAGVTWNTGTNLQTFSIANPKEPKPLGSIKLAPGESLRATRFDGDRAYVVTFRQIDPLFVVNLKDPAHPTVSGEVQAPGFSTYIEPLGDRLVTIGLVNWRPTVSLFDVSNPAAPKVLTQLVLGSENGGSSSEAVWDEKAFNVLPEENLILLPVSSSGEDHGWFSRVQLIDLFRDKLVKRGSITNEFSPRRATVVQNSIVAISPSRLVSVNAADRDKPILKADLEIAWRVDRVFSVGQFLVQLGGSAEWNDNRPSTLSISPGNDPDETLTTLELPQPTVLGATVKDDVLYVAQSPSDHLYFSMDGRESDEKQQLLVSAYDLSRLPAVRPLGSTSAQVPIGLGFGNLTAHWPSPGILVWSCPASGRSWSSWSWMRSATTNGSSGAEALVSGPGSWVRQWFYASNVRLEAFDFTRPEAPKFLSHLRIGANKPWSLSDAFDAPGMLYLSYKFFGKAHPIDYGAGDAAAPDGPPGDDPELVRGNRHYQLRVDYTDPTLPVIDDTGINLPGELRGVARQGKLLFTAGRNYDLTTGAAKAGSALQVSGFDGTAAHLLDTLPLTSLSQPLVIQDETIFTLDAQPAYTWVNGPYQPIDGFRPLSTTVINQYWWGGTWQPNDKTSLLSEWKLDSVGKFSKFDDIEAAHDTELYVFGDLVVTQDSNRTLHLFDASGASQLESLGDFTFDGWVWPDLDHAAGGLQTGLWVPLGQYGVEIVAEPQPAAN